MKNEKRFKKLLVDNFEANAWLDVALLPTVASVLAEDAAKNIYSLNSIWQIVRHLTCWREALLKKIKDKNPVIPDNNFFEELNDTSEEAWQNQLQRLEESQNAIIDLLKKDKALEWDEKPSKGNYSVFELMQSLLQHDAYHLGQVVMIKKLLGIANG